MKLLVFAHRGEAQAFFNEWDLQPVDFHFNGLFKAKNYYLLITGEGPKEAGEKTVAVLSSKRDEITEIFNIGIAGSLTPKLKVGDTVWVRSSYAQNADRCEFKSYTNKLHSSVDCITVFSRVTLKDERKTLSAFADIVDRELWAISSAAHLFRVEMSALKLISDDIDSVDMCSLIKDQAPALSKKLFLEFKNHEDKLRSSAPLELKAIPTDSIEEFILNHPKFYFTTSQTRKLTTVLRGLALKKMNSVDDLKKICQKIVETFAADKTSKELSKILLQEFSEMLNPLNTKIKNKLHNVLKPLSDSGAAVSFDPELEQEYIQINFQIRNTKDQKKLQLALEQFNYQKIKDIFKGELGDDV